MGMHLSLIRLVYGIEGPLMHGQLGKISRQKYHIEAFTYNLSMSCTVIILLAMLVDNFGTAMRCAVSMQHGR